MTTRPKLDTYIAGMRTPGAGNLRISKYWLVTAIAIALASVVALTLPDPKRGWIVVGIWLIYLPLFACGVSLIQLNYFCHSICHGQPGRNKVALTFDDGPDPQTTPVVLDWLAREKIPAAFFCLGRNVDVHPELVARIAAEGHLIGSHTYDHPWYISMMINPWLRRQLERGQLAVERACGIRPRYFRPPSGNTSPQFPAALRKLGLTMIGWDARSFDTIGTAEQAIARVLRLARDGSIVVLHDGNADPQRLLKILDAVAANLRSRGLDFERLDRLIEPEPQPQESATAS
jgi:peptidoglycan/xylan/chitin deacetylase (PgdA/CDA1 family)